MRKRVQIALAVSLVAIAGVIAWQVLRLREPVYQGKSASYWMNASLPPPDGGRKFFEIWKGLGPNAVPFLIQALNRHDGPVKKAYRIAWPKLPAALKRVLPAPSLSAWIVRTRAANALGCFGTASLPAVPVLVYRAKADEDVHVRFSATSALNQIGAEPEMVAPLLAQFINDTNFLWRVRQGVVGALGAMGTAAWQAVPALVLSLSDSNFNVRLAATNALMAIDPEAAAKAGVK